MSATPDTHPTAAASRPVAAEMPRSANTVARTTIISGLSIHTQMSSVAGAPIVYLLGDVADNSPIQVPEGVSLVNIGVDLWEENFSPWCAPRVFAKGSNFGDGAQKTLDTLINQVIPGRSWSSPSHRRIGCLWDTPLQAYSASGPACHSRSHAAASTTPPLRTSTPLLQLSNASELSRDRSGSRAFWTTLTSSSAEGWSASHTPIFRWATEKHEPPIHR